MTGCGKCGLEISDMRVSLLIPTIASRTSLVLLSLASGGATYVGLTGPVDGGLDIGISGILGAADAIAG